MRVIGIEPSPELLAHARRLAEGIGNLTFEVGDGAALPLDDASVDAVVYHTVLCHVADPARLLGEAMRVLKPGGTLVVCDADFSKASLAGFHGDPLQACADFFTEHFVTDRHLVGKLRTLVRRAGFATREFRVTSRTVTDADGMLVWPRLGGATMVERGEIGPSPWRTRWLANTSGARPPAPSTATCRLRHSSPPDPPDRRADKKTAETGVPAAVLIR